MCKDLRHCRERSHLVDSTRTDNDRPRKWCVPGPSVFGAPSFVVRYNLYTLTDASPADVHRLLYLERELRKEV